MYLLFKKIYLWNSLDFWFSQPPALSDFRSLEKGQLTRLSQSEDIKMTTSKEKLVPKNESFLQFCGTGFVCQLQSARCKISLLADATKSGKTTNEFELCGVQQ